MSDVDSDAVRSKLLSADTVLSTIPVGAKIVIRNDDGIEVAGEFIKYDGIMVAISISTKDKTQIMFKNVMYVDSVFVSQKEYLQ